MIDEDRPADTVNDAFAEAEVGVALRIENNIVVEGVGTRIRSIIIFIVVIVAVGRVPRGGDKRARGEGEGLLLLLLSVKYGALLSELLLQNSHRSRIGSIRAIFVVGSSALGVFINDIVAALLVYKDSPRLAVDYALAKGIVLRPILVYDIIRISGGGGGGVGGVKVAHHASRDAAGGRGGGGVEAVVLRTISIDV